MHLLAFLGGPEMIIIAVLGLLIFGRRLPSVARSLGSSYNQFRAGLKDDIAVPNAPKIDTPAPEAPGDDDGVIDAGEANASK